MKKQEKYAWELLAVLKKISSNKRLLYEFLEDLLTPTELNEVIARWQIIKQLDKSVPQRDIAKNLGVSIAKITRGSRELQDETGGFRQVLKKL